MNKLLKISLYALLPLIGILLFDWDWREVVILYWLENITVGIAAVITILHTTNTAKDADSEAAALYINNKPIPLHGPASRFILAGFFTLHYGLFTLVHGIFVFLIVGGAFTNTASTSPLELPSLGVIFLFWLLTTIVQSALTLQSSKAGEANSLAKSFSAPYARILVLHVTIFASIFLIAALQLPSAAAIFLIIIHAGSDWLTHRRASNKLLSLRRKKVPTP